MDKLQRIEEMEKQLAALRAEVEQAAKDLCDKLNSGEVVL